MDATPESLVHGPHLPNAVRENLPQVLREIESAIDDLVRAAQAFLQDPSQRNAEQVWLCGRLAWVLLLPYRRRVLRDKRLLIERFRRAVARTHGYLREGSRPKGELFERLLEDLGRREMLLSAMLAEDGEPRVRELLTADRMSVAVG
jgi:hypothetical protein